MPIVIGGNTELDGGAGYHKYGPLTGEKLAQYDRRYERTYAADHQGGKLTGSKLKHYDEAMLNAFEQDPQNHYTVAMENAFTKDLSGGKGYHKYGPRPLTGQKLKSFEEKMLAAYSKDPQTHYIKAMENAFTRDLQGSGYHKYGPRPLTGIKKQLFDQKMYNAFHNDVMDPDDLTAKQLHYDTAMMNAFAKKVGGARKPMSDEQKAAFAARMRQARLAKLQNDRQLAQSQGVLTGQLEGDPQNGLYYGFDNGDRYVVNTSDTLQPYRKGPYDEVLKYDKNLYNKILKASKNLPLDMQKQVKLMDDYSLSNIYNPITVEQAKNLLTSLNDRALPYALNQYYDGTPSGIQNAYKALDMQQVEPSKILSQAKNVSNEKFKPQFEQIQQIFNQGGNPVDAKREVMRILKGKKLPKTSNNYYINHILSMKKAIYASAAKAEKRGAGLFGTIGNVVGNVADGIFGMGLGTNGTGVIGCGGEVRPGFY